MKILYVARTDGGDNDDEGAIAHGLEQLGHEVVRIPENQGRDAIHAKGDFVLFHKWDDLAAMERLAIPAVFWFFDCVELNDTALRNRSRMRVEWINAVTERCRLGVLTDGDWVAKDTTGKLRHLMQGADQRRIGYASTSPVESDILFTGYMYGTWRKDAVDSLIQRYPAKVTQVVGMHGDLLADHIAGAKVCYAPDKPATDNYWSNRVYLTLGYRGFLVHPRCAKLESQYEDGKEIVYYDSRDHLYALMDRYLVDREESRKIAEAGHARTVAEHTYLHRCKTLLDMVKEVL